MDKRRREFDKPTAGLDRRGLYGGDLVFTEALANDLETAGERGVTEGADFHRVQKGLPGLS